MIRGRVSSMIRSVLFANTRRTLSTRPPPSPSQKQGRQKMTLLRLREMYRRREPITMLTAHDYPSARWCDNADVDMVLVGDSLGMVALGEESTTSVTMDVMLHHCRAVAKGAQRPFLVGDMPFGSFQVSPTDAVRNAIRFIQEGKMEAVKLEGGKPMQDTVRRIVGAGIPVLCHIGLTPQSIGALGGFRVQGKTFTAAQRLLEDALVLQDAGCFSIVIEAVPSPIATEITQQLSIPTIGIGAGNQCSGQVLVQQDMLGAFDKFVPKFCKQYSNMNQIAVNAIRAYCKDVKSRTFPDNTAHGYQMDPEELEKFLNRPK